jgi:hypothetical protein
VAEENMDSANSAHSSSLKRPAPHATPMNAHSASTPNAMQKPE